MKEPALEFFSFLEEALLTSLKGKDNELRVFPSLALTTVRPKKVMKTKKVPDIITNYLLLLLQ